MYLQKVISKKIILNVNDGKTHDLGSMELRLNGIPYVFVLPYFPDGEKFLEIP